VSAFDNDLEPLPCPEGVVRKTPKRTRARIVQALWSVPDLSVVWYVRWRVRGEPLRTAAPQFGDRIIAVLRTEIDSRGHELKRLDAEQAAREIAAAERARRASATEAFEQVSCPDRTRLQ
jgi:hypothetical protein